MLFSAGNSNVDTVRFLLDLTPAAPDGLILWMGQRSPTFYGYTGNYLAIGGEKYKSDLKSDIFFKSFEYLH